MGPLVTFFHRDLYMLVVATALTLTFTVLLTLLGDVDSGTHHEKPHQAFG